MKLSIGSRCVKYLMFIFNLLFVLTGIILLSIGIAIHGIYYEYHHFLDNKFLSVPSLLIAIGAIIFLIAFFGCCGAVRENYYLIITFTSLLVIVFILELSGGISGYVLRVRASTVVQDKMKETMKMYNSTEIQLVWDKLQQSFHCCGTENSSDWTNLHMDIPPSCYSKVEPVDPQSHVIYSRELYFDGCYNKFLSFIKSHALQLAGVGLGIAFIQLTGIMIISVGTTIYAVYEDFSNFLDTSYFSPATILIVVGIFVFVIAFLGCCGALRESTCMVLVFAVSLSIVLILELAAAIAAYALQDGIQDLVAEKMNVTMHQYGKNPEATDAIDFLQSRLFCCGYNGYEDWADIMKENQMDLPQSCRPWLHENVTCSSDNEDIACAPYTIGCFKHLSIIIHKSALYIGTGAVAIALIQLTGIMFTCMLGRAIRKQKTERERRKWELRESLVNGYQPLGKSDPFTTFPVVYMSSEPLKNP
ncbi:CD63 antigen [Anthophora plagiata]